MSQHVVPNRRFTDTDTGLPVWVQHTPPLRWTAFGGGDRDGEYLVFFEDGRAEVFDDPEFSCRFIAIEGEDGQPEG
jgi:hypothetical protein